MKQLLLKQKQVLYFVIAGALSAVVEIGSFKIFSEIIPQYFPQELDWHHINFPMSNIFSTSLGIITNYFLSIWFVFERGKHSKKREFTYFIVVSVISTLISLLLFQVFYDEIFKENVDLKFYVFSVKMQSKIAAILMVSILNYAVKKRFVFNG